MKKEIVLTEEERELIEAIRYYKRSLHNPSKTLKREAYELFYKIMDTVKKN